MSTVCVYGGSFRAAAASVVARSDCVSKRPLLIVHGFMCADKVGLAFFLARSSDVPAGRALFVVVGGICCLAVVLLLSVAGGFSADVAGCSTGPVAPTVGAAPGRSSPAREMSGNKCVVLSVRCL